MGWNLTRPCWSEEPSAAVYGKILELGTPDPLPEALVEINGTTLYAESDAQGAYRLTAAPGETSLRFSAAGFAPLVKNVRLQPGGDFRLDVSLERIDFAAKAIVVRGRKDKPQVLTTTVSRDEIKKIPGTAGDAVRAVQNLPGVALPSDLSSQLVVQGGGPWDNQYLLDNVPWPFPFHFGGILSTVNSNLLSSVDLNAAGFGVRWGNVLGAVLDAKTRAGGKDRLHAAADVNLVTAQGLVEGALGLGDASFTLSGRRSYFDLAFGGLLSETFSAFPYFWDLGGSLDFSLDAANHFRLLALGSDDVLSMHITTEETQDPNQLGEFIMDNRAVTAGGSWINTALPGLTSALTPYYFTIRIAEEIGVMKITEGLHAFGLKEEAEWKAGTWAGCRHEFGFGGGIERVGMEADVYAYKFVANDAPPVMTGTTVKDCCTNGYAYVQDRIQITPAWAVIPGVRYDKSDLVAGDVTNPRLSVEYQHDDRTLWKAAWGLYSQFPGAEELNAEFGNPALSANRAEHGVLSWERKLTREVMCRIDAYYKKYYDLAVNNPDLHLSVNQGLGAARGVELFLHADLGERFFGWLSYAYSKSERLKPPVNDWSLYAYDQPHILTLVGHYGISPAWSVGAKLRYSSGILQKTLTGRYQDGNGTWWPIFSDTYDQRLQDYLRLDLRTDYAWRYEGWNLNLYFEIINVFNRPNPAGLSYPRDYDGPPTVVNNLPFMPYFGLEAKF